MRFLARWLSDAVRLALALGAMQAPALAHQYASALLQITADARRDIEQRKTSARQFYRTAGETDEAVIAALRPVEPSNAQALEAIGGAGSCPQGGLRPHRGRPPPLLRPIVAAYDALEDPRGDKGAVLQTALDTHVPQVLISPASATYGLAGLMLGAFLAEALISVIGGLVRRRDRRSRIVG